jgi:uncharacterized lipoprotein YmbA
LLGKGTVEPTRFYLLEALAEPGPAASPTFGERSLGIGPVNLPRYLDRPSIVTRGGANEIYVADFFQWAEPLMDGVPRVVAEDLSTLLGTERVYAVPANLPEALDFRVVIDVIRFDGALEGEARLEARWTVLDLRKEVRVSARRSSVKTRRVESADYGALSAAMSRTLADLSAEIAEAVRGL